jgi:hypothetical protein
MARSPCANRSNANGRIRIDANPGAGRSATLIIAGGDPSCHNQDVLPYTLIGPRMDSGTLESPAYTVEQLRDVVGGDVFSIGVDLNQAMGHDDGAYDLMRIRFQLAGLPAMFLVELILAADDRYVSKR